MPGTHGSASPRPGARPAGMVLAAGLGTRLRPLTRLRPKALCPVGGIPLLDRAIERVAPFTGTGPEWLAVNAHHLAGQVVRHVGDRAHVSVETGRPLGTAGALGAVRDWLDGRDVLLTNADAWLHADLTGFVAGWDGERCRLLTRRVGPVGDFADRRYVGVCLLPWRLVGGLPAREGGLYEVLWRQEWRAGRLDLVDTDGTFRDCGTPADYLAANMDASGGASVVGQGARVEGTVERSVVWDGAHVRPGEHLVDAIRAGSGAEELTLRPFAAADR